MRNKYLILLLIPTLLILLHFSMDINEKYKINTVSYRLFKVESFDSATNCYLLSSKIDSIVEKDKYVIGLNIGVKWVSEEYDGIRSIFNKGQTDKGHIDTIKSISFISNGKLVAPLFKPSIITSFKITDSLLPNQSMNSASKCYESRKAIGLNELTKWYNSLTLKDRRLEDLTFYDISQFDAKAFLSNRIQLVYSFSNNSQVSFPMN